MSKIYDFLNRVRYRYYGIVKALVFVVSILLVIWQMPRVANFSFEYTKSKPWQHETLYAPFDFTIYKDEALLRQEQTEAEMAVMPIFVYDERLTSESRVLLQQHFEEQWNEKSNLDKAYNLEVLLASYDTIQRRGIVAHDRVLDDKKTDDYILILRNRVSYPTMMSDVYTLQSALEQLDMWLVDAKTDNQLLATLLANVLQPNVIYDGELTRRAVDQAVNAVSLTYGMVQKDELIVSEGEIVSDKIYDVLNSLHREYDDRTLSVSDIRRIDLSQSFFVIVLFLLLYVVVKLLYRKDIYRELRKINLILLLVLLVVLPSYWIIEMHPSFVMMMPMALLGILVVTFYGSSIALIVHCFAVILIALVVPNPLQYIVMQFVAGFVAILSLGKRCNRSEFFLASFYIFIAYFLCYIAFALMMDMPIEGTYVGILGLNALFTMLSLPLILILEKIFGIVTPLTLLELSNSNSPLLRRLASVAPGTFQHSIQVANLCEEVLYEIGGNPLLARAGALYHDIGKIENPIYFIENQHGANNPHNDISNAESAQIIISHVLDGINLAKKERLPESVIDFIRTHHGTRRTEYFYIMEKKQNPDAEIDERDFTYHGPIPYSKETAVLMIADSVEAASRSIKDINEQKISDLVDSVVSKQMELGQFDNADLTMKDFMTIKRVLKKKLMNIYHVRIAYPS